MMAKSEFEDRYKDAEQVDWDASGYRGLPSPWIEGDEIMVAEFWYRKDATEDVIDLSDGTTVSLEWFERSQNLADDTQGIGAVNQRKRKTRKVTQYILTGCEVLKNGRVAGGISPSSRSTATDQYRGKALFPLADQSRQRCARMHNYWRTTATELVARPTRSHAYLEYKKGAPPPQRQPFAGVPAGVLQEALNAADDMEGYHGHLRCLSGRGAMKPAVLRSMPANSKAMFRPSTSSTSLTLNPARQAGSSST